MKRTVTLFLAVVLCTFCFNPLAKLSAEDPKPQHFKLSEEAINRMPVVGEIVFSESKKPIELSTGGCFVGMTRGLVAHLLNELSTNVTIDRVKTSCGCTAAYPTEGPVVKGARSNLLLTLRIGKPGSFRTKLTLETNAGEFIVFVTGKARHRYEIPGSSIKYSAEQKGFIVELKLNDLSIPSDKTKLILNGQELPVLKDAKQENGKKYFIDERLVPANAMTTVIPLIGDREGTPLLLPLRIPGKLTLTQNVIYTNGERLYAVFEGDTRGRDFQSLEVEIDGIKYPVSVKLVTRGSKVICVSTIQDYEFKDFQTIRFLLDDNSFDAKVFLR